jgi:hypothetical protein
MRDAQPGIRRRARGGGLQPPQVAGCHANIGFCDFDHCETVPQRDAAHPARARQGYASLARKVGSDGATGAIFAVTEDTAPGFCFAVLSSDAASVCGDAAVLRAVLHSSLGMPPWDFRGVMGFPTAADGHRLCEPTMYQAADGKYVMLLRDTHYSHRMYISISADGRRWDPAVPTDIPDSPSLTTNVKLDDGTILLIGNQMAPAFDNPEEVQHHGRDPLMVSVSPDGYRFEEAFALRSGQQDWRVPPQEGEWGRFSRLSFRDLSCEQSFRFPNGLLGHDAAHPIADVAIEKLTIAGRRVDSPAAMDLATNEHVSDLRIDGTVVPRVLFEPGPKYAEGLCGPRSSQWCMVSENPDAQQPAWAPPRKLAEGLNLLTTPTVLADGTWIFPTGCWSRAGSPSRPLISHDHGQTFELGGELQADENPDFDEYMIVERADRNLVIFNRHPASFLQCESINGGRTWTRQTPNGIRHTNSRFVFMKLRSGNWLLVKHGSLDAMSDAREKKFPENRGRSHLTAYLSRDEGETWEGGLLLDERECSYPFGCQADDGTVYVSYERSRWQQPEILMARFLEEDILAAQSVSDRAALKVLVNKASGK